MAGADVSNPTLFKLRKSTDFVTLRNNSSSDIGADSQTLWWNSGSNTTLGGAIGWPVDSTGGALAWGDFYDTNTSDALFNGSILAPTAGIVNNLRLFLNTAATSTFTATVAINGALTSLSCNTTNGIAASNLDGLVNVTAGDRIAVAVTSASGQTLLMGASVKFWAS